MVQVGKRVNIGRVNYLFGDVLTSEETLYFGYGSNLDADDWSKWCTGKGYNPDGMTEIGPAWLPDYTMKFHYNSTGRGGGAADVVRIGPGTAVPGVLFHLDEQALDAMDIKEGVAVNCYERRIVHVCTPDGHVREALTYTVVEGRRESHHVAPTEEYQQLIRTGLKLRDLPTDELENAIRDGGMHFPIPHVFTYGTLMQGENRHHVIQELSSISATQTTTAAKNTVKPVTKATTAGALLDLGQFPGIIPAGSDCESREDTLVQGELYTLPEMFTALQHLDQIEGYHGAGDDSSLFRRAIIEVDAEGVKKWAWVYFYNGIKGENPAWPVIECGDWRGYRNSIHRASLDFH